MPARQRSVPGMRSQSELMSVLGGGREGGEGGEGGGEWGGRGRVMWGMVV